MGFNKIYLQDLKEVKKDYKQDPKAFKRRIQNAEALIGPTNSMQFVKKIMKEK